MVGRQIEVYTQPSNDEYQSPPRLCVRSGCTGRYRRPARLGKSAVSGIVPPGTHTGPGIRVDASLTSPRHPLPKGSKSVTLSPRFRPAVCKGSKLRKVRLRPKRMWGSRRRLMPTKTLTARPVCRRVTEVVARSPAGRTGRARSSCAVSARSSCAGSRRTTRIGPRRSTRSTTITGLWPRFRVVRAWRNPPCPAGRSPR